MIEFGPQVVRVHNPPPKLPPGLAFDLVAAARVSCRAARRPPDLETASLNEKTALVAEIHRYKSPQAVVVIIQLHQ